MRASRLVHTVIALLVTTATLAGCGVAGFRPASGRSRAVAPLQGRVLARTIPGGASGFVGRPAEIYLPPRALHDPRARMPVVELLHGVPGGPTDWVVKGRLLDVASAFASNHDGEAPIVVMPDINGSRRGDTECIRTPTGADVEQYLAQVVPSWVIRNLPATTDHHRWLVAGVSEGGTCAAMLSLRHPQVFPAFADLSGLAQPTVGAVNDPPKTIRQLFGGSVAAYDEHDPLWLLRHGHVRTRAAWIAAGANDLEDRSNQSALAGAAQADGVPVRTVIVAGGHHWAAWTSALEQMLPWFWQQPGP